MKAKPAPPEPIEPMEDIEIHFNAPENATPAELAAYLDEACGGDSDLRSRVEALFAAADSRQEFMAQAPVENLDEMVSADVLHEDVGQTIGKYKLLQRIGEGGFGVVYMADQSAPVKRRVALKIIKLGMDTRQVVARFEAERQALAMMDHPNIATVHDAGATGSGRPYFVMELVRGIPITEFCEEQGLDTRARLALFIDVCSAVQHAHQKGIIHRDLKPSNVIVTLHDDKAVPKVIDFGVAKATQQDLTDKTLFTQFEQFIGTPAYMSPEQAQMSGLDIDTRSDIYSLGALLYELLTGTTPFNSQTLARAGQDEVKRVIREEEPPRPSTRLTELQRRATSQPQARVPGSTVARDLDWIVMKALEKDRRRRYETANGLAADVRRHLADEPVEAGAPSTLYRLGKYAKRHRAMVGTLAAVGTALAIAATVSTVFYFSERQSRKTAVAAESQATKTKLAAEHGFAEELLGARKTALGMAKLAQLVREDDQNHVAASRLMSAIQGRNFPRVIQQFPIAYSPDISPDGSLVVTTATDEKAFQVWEMKTGERVGAPIPYYFDNSRRELNRAAEFHPTEPWILTESNASSPPRGCVRVWNYETGKQVGEPVTFEGATYFAKFSADGRYVISGSDSNETKVTYAETGALSFPTIEGSGNAFRCAVSPDGKLFAVVYLGSAYVIDAQSGDERCPPIRHAGNHLMLSIAFSPDSQMLATGSSDQTARLWEVATGGPVGEPLSHHARVESVEFSPDGNLLLTTSADNRVQVWDVESGDRLIDPIEFHRGALRSAHFHPRGHQLVTAAEEAIQVWDVGTGRELGQRFRQAWTFADAVFSPDGASILAWGPGGPCHLIEAPSEQARSQVFRHPENEYWSRLTKFVTSANFNPDGSLLVSGGADGKARVWDSHSGEQLKALPIRGRASWVTFNPDGSQLLASSSTGGGIRIWDTRTWERLTNILAGEMTRFAAFSPSPDEEGDWQIIDASTSTSPQIWNGRTGGAVGRPFDTDLRNTRTMIDTVAFSPDKKLVVTTSQQFEALLWDAETSALVRRLDGDFGQAGHSDYLRSVAFSPDGSRILTSSNDDTARLWDTATGKQLTPPMRHAGDVTYAAFSPDGRSIVTASRDTTARVWDSETGLPLGVPMQHGAWVGHAAFDPTGERVITASDDMTARVWDAATGIPLSEPLAHAGQSLYATFSPDGRRALTAGEDGAARLWETPPIPQRPVPPWLATWIEAIVGLRLDESAGAVKIGWAESQKLQAEALRQAEGDDYYGRFVRWFYDDPASRPISPFSQMSLDGYVENRLRERDLSGSKHVAESLEEVIRLKPEDPRAYAAMVKRLLGSGQGELATNLRRAAYYARQAAVLDPSNETYAELVERIADDRRQLEQVAEIVGIEDRAKRAYEAGNKELGENLLTSATIDRVLLATSADWPSEAQRSAVLANWWEICPATKLVRKGATWKYFDARAPQQASDWRDLDFDDSEWMEGAAPLGYGDDGEVTELDPGEEGAKRLTFYFRRRFDYSPVELGISLPTLGLRLRRDDGAVIYLNGQEILRSNMPDGEIGEQTLAVSAAANKDEKQFLEFTLDSANLIEGENVLAVEVHQVKTTSSDVSFDLELVVAEHPTKRLRDLIPKGDSDLETKAKMHWILGDHDGALGFLDKIIGRLSNSVDPAEVRTRKEWLRTKVAVLRSANRVAESKLVLDRITAAPPRHPDTDPKQIDLTEVYNDSLFQLASPVPRSASDTFQRLPETFGAGDAPGFDLRGIVQLNSGILPAEGNFEEGDFNTRTNAEHQNQVTIPVSQKCKAIHFLHSCRWGREELGAAVSTYRVHFADVTSEPVEVQVIYGEHMVDFWIHRRSEKELAGIKQFAWQQDFDTGNGTGTMALTRQTWENERHQDKMITHIDFISAGKKAAPFLVGITLE